MKHLSTDNIGILWNGIAICSIQNLAKKIMGRDNYLNNLEFFFNKMDSACLDFFY